MIVRRRSDQIVNIPHEPNLKNKSIKVWGLISWDGVGKLIRYEGMMDSEKYQTTLKAGLKGYVQQLKRKEVTFMQDNASCHTSKDTKEFFKKQKFEPMLWPPSSPDLNPIENIWSVMKQGLWKRRSEIKNAEDTWRVAQQLWYQISEDLIRKIYKSLPKRCDRVIDFQGQRIKTH